MARDDPPPSGRKGSASEGHTASGVTEILLTMGSQQVVQYKAGSAELVTLDLPAEAVDRVTMIPLRGVLEPLGAYKTYWEGMVTVVDGVNVVAVAPGPPTALVNSQEISLPRPAEIRNGVRWCR